MTFPRFAFALLLCLATALPAQAGPKRNVVIFVADGLRYSSVTPETAPTMVRVRREGVDFNNTHAAYPTLTTANASVIATGHYLGDTGNYGNTLFTGFPVPCHQGMTVTFIEDDCILRDIKGHLGDNYIGQTTLLEGARPSSISPRSTARTTALTARSASSSTKRPTIRRTATARRPRVRCWGAGWPPTFSKPPARTRPPSPRRPI
jgi:hypothetical protein